MKKETTIFCGLTHKALILFILCFAISACAKKPEKYYFFPPEPQAPRVQYLTSFANISQLKDNEFLTNLIGEMAEQRVQRPFGIDISAGSIYVADPGKEQLSVAVFDLEKQKLQTIHGPLKKPADVFRDNNGDLYVVDSFENVIIRFNEDKSQTKYYGKDLKDFYPTSVFVKDDRLYVTDIQKHYIRVFDKNSGEHLFKFGGAGELGWPHDIIVDNSNRLIVTETGKARISIYDLDGNIIKRFGTIGDRPGNFVRPKSAAVDKEDNIYVTDTAFSNVQIFDKDGNVRMAFGGNMVMPAGIDIDYDAVKYFQKYASPDFTLEYIIAVTSQGAPPDNQGMISIFGFGRKAGYNYD